MIKFLAFYFLLAISYSSCVSGHKLNAKAQKAFPENWIGNWGGTLKIYAGKGLVQIVPMEVIIKKIDTSDVRYNFELIYGENKQEGRRPYQLIVKDPSNGLFVNDEMNSIQMEEYFIGNKLYCWFEVEGTLLLSTFEKMDNKLFFEIVAGSSIPISNSGGQKFNGEDIPLVKTYPVKSCQKATLIKKK